MSLLGFCYFPYVSSGSEQTVLNITSLTYKVVVNDNYVNVLL